MQTKARLQDIQIQYIVADESMDIAKREERALETMTEAIDRWDRTVGRYLETRKGGPDGNTAKTYGRTLKGYRQFALSEQLNLWGADAIIAYNRHQQGLRKVNGGHLADDTIAARLTHIQAFFRWAYTWRASPLTPEMLKGLIDIPPRRQLSPRDILDPLEIEAMLKIAYGLEDKRSYILLRLLADTGLRVSEALDVKAEDVYWGGGRWYVHVAKGKGDKARDVEIPHDLAKSLMAQKRAEGLPLFNLSRVTAYRWVRKLAEQAGVTHSVSPHSLRHTHGHTLALLGWPLEAIGARLGHSSYEVTQRYTRPAKLAKALRLPTMPWAGAYGDDGGDLGAQERLL